MVLVSVLAEHVYADRKRRVGEHYAMEEQYLPLMLALGRVALAARSAEPLHGRDDTPDPTIADDPDADSLPRTRRAVGRRRPAEDS